MADNHQQCPAWTDYDHLAVNAQENPMETLGPLIAACPVGRSERHGGFYVFTRYADCIAAARDPHLTSRVEEGPGPGFPFVFHDLLRMPMITDDGARHRDFRMPLQKLFSPAYARSLRDDIEAICDRLIDGFVETGTGDLADQFSIELPAVLIADLLELPHDRRREFQHWACDAVAKGSIECVHNIANYTAELYDYHRAKGGGGIPAQILEFEIEGRPITAEEWRGIIMLLIFGGLDTTANAGGYIFHMIGSRPDLRRYLLEDAGRIPAAVQEFVRFISPVPQHSRGVTADAEIAGHSFAKGDVVLLNWYAANHDPAAFDDPEEFRPERKLSHHLGFGYGVHLCLGRHLALVELEVMIERVLARLPDFALVEGGTVRFPGINRGMSNLRVTFTPGARLAR